MMNFTSFEIDFLKSFNFLELQTKITPLEAVQAVIIFVLQPQLRIIFQVVCMMV